MVVESVEVWVDSIPDPGVRDGVDGPAVVTAVAEARVGQGDFVLLRELREDGEVFGFVVANVQPAPAGAPRVDAVRHGCGEQHER